MNKFEVDFKAYYLQIRVKSKVNNKEKSTFYN